MLYSLAPCLDSHQNIKEIGNGRNWDELKWNFKAVSLNGIKTRRIISFSCLIRLKNERKKIGVWCT